MCCACRYGDICVFVYLLNGAFFAFCFATLSLLLVTVEALYLARLFTILHPHSVDNTESCCYQSFLLV